MKKKLKEICTGSCGMKMSVKLGDILTISRGASPRPISKYITTNSDGINWIKIGDVEPNSFYITKTEEKITPEGAKKSRLVKEGDFILSNSMSFGRPYILKINGCVHDGWLILSDYEETLISSYLYYLLRSPVIQSQFDGSANGSTVRNLNSDIVRNVKVSIHTDKKVQKDIVNHLDTIQSAIDNKKQQLSLLDEAVKSKFVEMFGDFSECSKIKWEIKSFTEVAKIDGNMVNDFTKYADYPHIGIDSIEKNTGELKGYRTVKEDNVISGKYLFTPEHIIYSKIRPNLNKVALPTFHGVCSADAYPILVDKSKCNRYYLAYLMRSDYFLTYILAFASRAGMPKVNREQVNGFKLPVPPLSLQTQFAAFVQQIDKSKSLAKQQIADLQELLDSKMQQYFA